MNYQQVEYILNELTTVPHGIRVTMLDGREYSGTPGHLIQEQGLLPLDPFTDNDSDVEDERHTPMFIDIAGIGAIAIVRL